MFSKGTPVTLTDGFTATVVAYRPSLGGYVVAMSGNDGEIPGEQWVVAPDEIVS